MATIQEVWNLAPRKKREELAKVLGYKKEWAKIRYEDLPKRGGGMLQADLSKVFKIWKRG